jgi:XTP/dITP diphosphohydrolase
VKAFVLATAKAREISEILGPTVALVARPEFPTEVAETGGTLLANARIKAWALVEATGTPAIADDTGLEVDALAGQPGVRSARYAGDKASYADNVAKLLSALAAVAGGDAARTARFRTVAVAAWPDGREIFAEGTVEGRIAWEARGSAGFGYDPVFVPDGGDGRTFAEMAGEEKNELSHRAKAFRCLAAKLGS